jgi:hypothetical protein
MVALNSVPCIPLMLCVLSSQAFRFIDDSSHAEMTSTPAVPKGRERSDRVELNLKLPCHGHGPFLDRSMRRCTMATLWHVGDLIELICEFDDSPTHLTTLRRVSWSFHRAVENVWTLLLGRQNSIAVAHGSSSPSTASGALPLHRIGAG